MDFTDVEDGAYIYWCSACGPWANKINDALIKACDEQPGFKEKFARAMKEVEPS